MRKMLGLDATTIVRDRELLRPAAENAQLDARTAPLAQQGFAATWLVGTSRPVVVGTG